MKVLFSDSLANQKFSSAITHCLSSSAKLQSVHVFLPRLNYKRDGNANTWNQIQGSGSP
ncbi:hypothetical protein K443DRAFT_671562 [Laccaria amethystina LaAM-08-1]|uniref:Uncharacterized protein n=1 Tax=Laccaria amethystina LaAM-08-1 TaxID=1095629 RepID=A0A0C9Y6P4_9AGAR|nr:hypothetical protein K443DRAFT_671562 [Laccaria amethystina LaAM-08-1]